MQVGPEGPWAGLKGRAATGCVRACVSACLRVSGGGGRGRLRVRGQLQGADAVEVGAGGEADPGEGDEAQGAPDREGHAHLPT